MLQTSDAMPDLQAEKVQGFFLVEDINLVKKEKGEPGYLALKNLTPSLNLDQVSPIKKYSIQQEIELLRGVAIVVYGDDSPESWKKLGAHEVETVKNSPLGKILLALFTNDYREIVKNGFRVLNAFSPFIGYSYTMLGDKSFEITTTHNPYPKEYYLGSLMAFRDMYERNAHCSVREIGPGTYIYSFNLQEATHDSV